jgi:hypothetical protein
MAAGNQQNPRIVSCGASGAIITWEDNRSGSSDIYTQRVNSAGTSQWTANGVAVSVAAGNQMDPQIVSDGASGAIITWEDTRSGTNSDIYAQRVSSTGIPQWTANGVVVSAAAGDRLHPQVSTDGAGGAIIAWEDYRSGTNLHIYAQKVNGLGTVQWVVNGVAVCTAGNDQFYPRIVSDGSGGAIITWMDYRNGTGYGYSEIYAQRVNSTGVPQWIADGVAICTAVLDQINPRIVSDDAGGAIITWGDYRIDISYSSAFSDIYAQRVNSAGTPQWTADGIVISMGAHGHYNPEIVSDGAGGAIITWDDYRSGTIDDDIDVQRVSASGGW